MFQNKNRATIILVGIFIAFTGAPLFALLIFMSSFDSVILAMIWFPVVILITIQFAIYAKFEPRKKILQDLAKAYGGEYKANPLLILFWVPRVKYAYKNVRITFRVSPGETGATRADKPYFWITAKHVNTKSEKLKVYVWFRRIWSMRNLKKHNPSSKELRDKVKVVTSGDKLAKSVLTNPVQRELLALTKGNYHLFWVTRIGYLSIKNRKLSILGRATTRKKDYSGIIKMTEGIIDNIK
ncbi:hypothetical protein ACFL2D_02045 [Patescibacteria group bacterium]